MKNLPQSACLLLLLLPACGEDSAAAPASGPPADLNALTAVFRIEPPSPPADNPITEAKVALGRTLYHDTRMSKGNDVSCATCHDLAKAGTDRLPTSKGTGGQVGKRNAPTTLNAFRQFRQFWDGRAATVEEQATGPILNPIEHGMPDENAVVAVLRRDPEIVAAFEAAFPGEEEPVTLANVGKAIGAFGRTLVTRSPFDRFLDGEDSALTDQQKRGLRLFVETGCTSCHMMRTVGGGIFQKLGLVHPFDTEDRGREEVSGNPADRHMFKVPLLLNVAETGPWFHDGSVQTLEEAVRLMAWHQLGKKLEPAQVTDLVAFLRSLTGELEGQ